MRVRCIDTIGLPDNLLRKGKVYDVEDGGDRYYIVYGCRSILKWRFEPVESDLHKLTAIISGMAGDVSNMDEGITNRSQLPRLRKGMQQALDLLREMNNKAE